MYATAVVTVCSAKIGAFLLVKPRLAAHLAVNRTRKTVVLTLAAHG